jgi:hypothetical protein
MTQCGIKLNMIRYHDMIPNSQLPYLIVRHLLKKCLVGMHDTAYDTPIIGSLIEDRFSTH